MADFFILKVLFILQTEANGGSVWQQHILPASQAMVHLYNKDDASNRRLQTYLEYMAEGHM